MYKSVVVCILYAVCLQMFASFLSDPKGSHTGRACDVCRVERYE
jgi:hypothetical protein